MSMYLREKFALTRILAPVVGVGAPGPVLKRSGHLLHSKTFGLVLASALVILLQSRQSLVDLVTPVSAQTGGQW